MWVDDEKDAPWAQAHGLAGKGYPNLAIYGPDGDYVHRVIGFGGMESWMPQVKAADDTAKKLAAAKEQAAKDPAAWAAVADAMSAIPDRERDALEAVRKVPADKRDASVEAVEKRLVGTIAWLDLSKEADADMRTRTSTLDRNDKPAFQAGVAKAWKEHGEAFFPKIDAFLAEHSASAPNVAPTAMFHKVRVLMSTERRDEAVALAKEIVAKFPDSNEAKMAERVINPPAKPPAQRPPTAPPAPPQK